MKGVKFQFDPTSLLKSNISAVNFMNPQSIPADPFLHPTLHKNYPKLVPQNLVQFLHLLMVDSLPGLVGHLYRFPSKGEE